MEMFTNSKAIGRLLALLATCVLLSACGGGGGGGGGGGETASNTSSSASTDYTAEINEDGTVTLSSVSLGWTAPVEREDGTPIVPSELSGFVIRYRLFGALDYETILINDPSTDEIILEELTPGVYEFSIAAIDTNGVYSAYSDSSSIELTS